MKEIVNVSTYKFVALHDLVKHKEYLIMTCRQLGVLGTILLSTEGINIMVAGTRQQIDRFSSTLRQHACFSDLAFKESFSDTIPFKRMRVRIKSEIITLGVPTVDCVQQSGKHIQPLELKQWLDQGRDVVLLDTRND